MRAMREGEEFGPELVKPGRLAREEHAARLDPGRTGAHAHYLVALRLDRNGVDAISLEVLDQACSRALILNQDGLRVPALLLGDNAFLKSRIFESLPDDIQDVDLVLGHEGGYADRVV